MIIKNDGFDHARAPKTQRTKQKMSASKIGVKKSATHRLNMRVTQLVNACKRHNIPLIQHIINHPRYTIEERHDILVNLSGRNYEGADDGLEKLHKN